MENSETKRVQALKAHLALNVKDVKRSTEFYRRMLGLEPSKIRTGYAKFDIQNPPLNLTLNENPFKERGALSHLGIQVGSTADVLAMRERWADAGLITRDEMQTDCCYATQDKTWVRDPDGNEWEAFVVLQDNLPESSPCECGNKVAEAEVGTETVDAARDAATPAATTGTASCCGATMPAVEASSCCEVTASSLVQPTR